MEIKPNNIYCGDCYKLIKDIPDKSVDCIYTDVPYLMPNAIWGAGFMRERIERVQKEEIDSFKNGIDYAILDDFVRVLKKLNIFIWCNKFMIKDLLDYFIDKIGCVKYEIMVWCKTNPIPMTKNVWLSDLEYCLWFGDKTTRLNDGYALKSKYYESSLNTKQKKEFGHPTVKPLELVQRHIEHATQKGDVVLDPFIGSGTTAIACSNLDRKYIGIEIEPRYCETARNRLNKINKEGQIGMFFS